MTDNQAYWDALLIRGWRKFQTMNEVLHGFRSITGIDAHNSTLLRTPQGKYATEVRGFVASRLPRVSVWLNKCGPEHDTTLLKKLSLSKMTAATETCILPDQEKVKLYQEMHKAKAVVEFNKTKRLNRNDATNWNVVKGPSNIKMRRR